MTLLASGVLPLLILVTLGLLTLLRCSTFGTGLPAFRSCRMRPCGAAGMLMLAGTIGLAFTDTCQARRGHGTRGASAANKPANAGEAVCHTRARDYAYEKHADVGQERLFFEKCMGR